jgi:hypothetical protein
MGGWISLNTTALVTVTTQASAITHHFLNSTLRYFISSMLVSCRHHGASPPE